MLHVAIVFGCLALSCWPYLGQIHVWLLLAFIGITHYTQDWAKITFTSQSKHGLFFFILDQVLHILFISVIFLTNIRHVSAPFNEGGNALIGLYNNNFIILILIGAISASYMAHYMILLIKIDYLNMKGTVSTFEKRYGFLERIIIFFAIIAGQLWFISIPVILALRPTFYKAAKGKLNVSSRFASWQEIVLSGSGGVLTGLALYALI